MFLKRTAITSACVAAFFAFWMVPAPSSAQDMRLNVGCPSLDDPNVGNYSIDQLNKWCQNDSGGGNTKPTAPEGGAALSCGQHRMLARQARINVGYTEGNANQAVADSTCAGVPDNQLPADSQPGGNQLVGNYRFVRGYHTKWTGRKAEICKTRYDGTARLDRGTVVFTSGGHTWRGSIAQNSYISITRDGVTPRPRNPTVISGLVTNAKLYNGYCGRGYFRLLVN